MSRPSPRWLTVAAAAALTLGVLALPARAEGIGAPPGSGVATSAFTVERAQQAQARFDRRATRAPAQVTGWWVDQARGVLVVELDGAPSPATQQFLVDPDPAVVAPQPGRGPVRTLADLVGGQRISSSSGRCSIGASVRNGAGKLFVMTAGHCTANGTRWSGPNGQDIGPVRSSNFPRNDFGAIEVANTAGWTGTPKVQGGPTVKGTTEAPVGAQVCGSGFSTGYRCGVVKAKNVTSNYGGGVVVYGLTSFTVDVCGQPGDSGGTVVTPDGQLQGLVSGGTCPGGGGSTVLFQPINPALSAYRMTAVTG